jgi:hypothetical protein
MLPQYFPNMNKNLFITYCITIKNHQVYGNGNLLFESADNMDFHEFTKSIYKTFEINYPKFYKMDNLSKLAFLSSELIIKKTGFEKKYTPDEVAVILFNSASSLDTDIKFQNTIDDKSNYFPNPSLFVYTLPNIMVGEICIKNNFKGENALIVFDKFEPELLTSYVDILSNNQKMKACLTGWIDFNPLAEANKFEAFLCLAEHQETGQDMNYPELNAENILKPYKNQENQLWKN